MQYVSRGLVKKEHNKLIIKDLIVPDVISRSHKG